LNDRTAQNPALIRLLVIGCGLLLGIFLAHLIAIDTFPPFIDELIHVHGSEQAYGESLLTNANLGRQFTIWWMMLFQAHQGSPIWVGRVAMLLAVLPGVAALMGSGQRAAGKWGMVLAGLFYLFSNYHFFFGRLALADPIAGSAVLVAIYFSYRLSRRIHWHDAILTALFLFLAIGAKISTLPYLGIPIAAALTLRSNGRSWRAQLRWAVIASLTAIVLVIGYVGGMRLFKQDVFSNSVSYALTRHGRAAATSLFDVGRILRNVQFSLDILTGYLGATVVILSLAAMLILVLQRRFYVVLCALAPLAIIWINQIQESRFLFVPAALLLFCGASVLGDMLRRQARAIQTLGMGLALAWGLLGWLPFIITAARDPVQLPLPNADFDQYVRSDASGFGLAEVRQIVRSRQPTLVIGLLSNCQALRYLSLSDFPVECPTLRPSGANIDALTALMETRRAPGVYVVLEQLPFVPVGAPGSKIAEVERPGGGPTLSIYELSPDA